MLFIVYTNLYFNYIRIQMISKKAISLVIIKLR